MGDQAGRREGPELGLGAGPVFAYEWVVASRRWQGYALRSLFVAALLTALVVVWAGRSDNPVAPTLRQLAEIGQLFYQAVTGTALTLVLLAAPAATAGAICLDRARGALTHLLVTDLTDREIVLGKLAARLVPVLGLVGCALPLMALLTLLGGVDPDALLGSFLVTLGVAALGCSLALTFSLWAGKTHEALLGTYAVWGLWLLARPMLRQLGGALGVALPLPPANADPFVLILAPYWWPGTVGWGDYLAFLGVTLALSAGLAALAVFRLRPVCTREVVKKTKPAPGTRREGRLARARALVSARLPGPSLDGNPVLWREWHRARPSRWGRGVAAVFVALAATFSAIATASGTGNLAAWVNALQVSVGLLLLSVTAATSLAEERVRGSLDVLMATPLSTRSIVTSKWLGTFRHVPGLAVLPAAVVYWGKGWGDGQWVASVLIAAFVLAAGAAVTGLGLLLATWCARLGRAVGLTVTVYILVTVGWIFVVMALVRHGPGVEGLMMASPFFWAGEFSFEMVSGRPARAVGWGAFWVFVYTVAATALLALTLATFNRRLGRVEVGFAPPRRRGWEGYREIHPQMAQMDADEEEAENKELLKSFES